ncbi:hypothetical protein ACFU53_26910 [Streptomyces sp. NPDC057474]|uniref:hypothetical protein n=1 Tax=Streptomyces sp. NPDC057474 TaxID=3346144 RepID=UPI003697C227
MITQQGEQRGADFGTVEGAGEEVPGKVQRVVAEAGRDRAGGSGARRGCAGPEGKAAVVS